MLFVGSTLCLMLSAVYLTGLLQLKGFDAALSTVVLVVAQVVLLSLGSAAFLAYARAPLALSCLALAVLSVTGHLLVRKQLLPERWRLPNPARPYSFLEWVTWSMVLLVTAHVVVRAVLAVRLVPYGYDALSYHLAAVGWLVQDGRLPGAETGALTSGYPLDGELLAAWPAVLLHDDVLSSFVQLPMALLGGAAVIGLARGVGCSRESSVLSGCLFVLTPALLAQTTTAYVDVTAAALALTASCFLVRWAASSGSSHGYALLMLAGVAAGLAVGTKQTNAALVIVLLVAVAVFSLRMKEVKISKALTCLVVPAALTGGFWYVRNWLVFGNPLYPVAVAGLPGPLHLNQILQPAPGPPLPAPLAIVWSWAHDLLPQTQITYEQRSGGLGTLFVWCGLPCLMIATVRALRRRDAIWALLLSSVLIPFAIQPHQWWARFTFPLAALASVAIATVLSGVTDKRLENDARVTPSRFLLLGVLAAVLAVQPALVLGAVTPAHGTKRIAAWELFSAPHGDRLAGDVGGPAALEAVADFRTVGVVVSQVGRTGSLFGGQFERTVRAVASTDPAAFAKSLLGVQVLVACRSSKVGRWADGDQAHFRRLSDPRSDLAVWQVVAPPRSIVDTPSQSQPDDAYCT